MIVTDVVDRPFEEQFELSALLGMGGKTGGRTRLFFRRPAPAGPTAAPGDVFLAALLIPAMALGEPLTLEAPVSEDLLEAAERRLVPTLLDWHPRLTPVPVHAARVADPSPAGAGVAATLFSSGIDSWHTLLRREGALDHLVHIRGFEMPYEDEASWRAIHARVRATAARKGLEVLPVGTNARAEISQRTRAALAARGTPWPKLGTEAWFGSFLVAVGRLLHPPLGRLFVPASWTGEVARGVASHPAMEPAWSTPSMAYEIDGFDEDRTEKLDAILAREPAAVRDLCVCVDTTARARRGLNCGRCIKCVRLAFELRLAGVAPEDSPLPEPLDLARVKVRRVPHGDLAIWEKILARAERQGDRAAQDAILVLLDRKFHLPRFLRDVRRRVRGALRGPRPDA